MRGIEAAFWGTLLQDVEAKISVSGKTYANFGCAVVTGKADNGKDVSQYIRVSCFGEAAETLAARAKKGDCVYCEGSLTQTQWNDRATGEVKYGLNLAAWKCERVANIGKHREHKESGNTEAASMPSADSNRPPANYCAGPAPRNQQRRSADDFDFERGDPLPF